MKALINKKHFVTDALVTYKEKQIECRLIIDLDKTYDKKFLITKIALRQVIEQCEFEEYNKALDYFKAEMNKFL